MAAASERCRHISERGRQLLRGPAQYVQQLASIGAVLGDAEHGLMCHLSPDDPFQILQSEPGLRQRRGQSGSSQQTWHRAIQPLQNATRHLGQLRFK